MNLALSPALAPRPPALRVISYRAGPRHHIPGTHMSQERIVQLLEEIRDLLASQVKLIAEIQQRNEQSEEHTRTLVEKRAKEMRATRLRDIIIIGIMLVTISLLVVSLAYRALVR